MITITQDIPEAFLAGSPVVLRGNSDCIAAGGSMHRVICSVICSVSGYSPYREELVFPLDSNDLDGPFVFNFSNACLNSLELANKYGAYYDTIKSSYVSFRIRECYLLNGETVYGPDEYISEGNHVAYPGAWTDIERYMHPEYEDFGMMANRFLTRFPKGERRLAVLEQELRIPSVGTFVNGVASNYGSKKPTFHYLGNTTFEGLDFYVVADTARMHYMHFVNGFGLVETVFFESDDAVTHNTEKKTYRIPPLSNFSGIDTVTSYPGTTSTVRKMTTGLMSRKMAEWFLFEVCASKKVWLFDKEINEFVEGVIEGENSVTPIDAAKGAGCAIELTFRPAMQGSMSVRIDNL